MWNAKNVLIVEGEGTAFGCENDLLDNVNSVHRIVAPAVNAYDKIDDIQKAIRKFLDQQPKIDDVLILTALGPTATILAANFSEFVQTVDIGHFDLQYEYFRRGAYKRVTVKNRYDNEVVNGDKFIKNTDKKYIAQIFEKIN
jgi:Domain of unknown function (DUF1792).